MLNKTKAYWDFLLEARLHFNSPNIQIYYHVAKTEDIATIIEDGIYTQTVEEYIKLVPNDDGEPPESTEEELDSIIRWGTLFGDDPYGILLFKEKDEAEDAIANWLGDEFPGDADLSIVAIGFPNDTTIEEKAPFSDPNAKIYIFRDYISAENILATTDEYGNWTNN